MNYTKENQMTVNLNELTVNVDEVNGKKIVAFRKSHENGGTNAATITLEDGKTYTSVQLVKLGVKVGGDKKPRTEGKKNEAKLHEKELAMLHGLVDAFGEEVTLSGLIEKLQKAQDDDEAQKQKERDEKKAQKKIEGVDDDILLAVAAKRLGLSVEQLKAIQTTTEGETEEA